MLSCRVFSLCFFSFQKLSRYINISRPNWTSICFTFNLIHWSHVCIQIKIIYIPLDRYLVGILYFNLNQLSNFFLFKLYNCQWNQLLISLHDVSSMANELLILQEGKLVQFFFLYVICVSSATCTIIAINRCYTTW